MREITFTNSIKVQYVDWMGSDRDIVRAARVSTQGDMALNDEGPVAGLIGYLMKNRHGSPFEQGAMKFYVNAPQFVWMEHDRHRIGVSQNRESMRYKELEPEFYVPNHARTQTGKPGHYVITEEPELDTYTQASMMDISERAWIKYQEMLMQGVAKEMARMVLPLNIMTSGYVMFNPRSLMHFLSLRVESEESTFVSKPQKEIEDLALQYERHFARSFPLTHQAFKRHGRVCP